MRPHHYRDMIIRAVADKDGDMLNRIVGALVDAEDAKRILRAKGYGEAGQTIYAAARLVPAAKGE